MESLTGLNDTTEKEAKNQDVVGRIKIGRAESDKLTLLVEQARGTSKGFTALSKSDVVNFLIREHKPELSPKQIQHLRAQFYDPIRHMNWITQALKEALAGGDTAVVANLQEEIKGIELSVVSKARKLPSTSNSGESLPFKPKKQRTKKGESADLNFEPSFAEIQSELPEG